MKQITLLVVLLLIGCTRYIPAEINRTIYKEIVVYNGTTEYINITAPCPDCVCNCNTTNGDSDPKYVIGLIQELKRCEANLYSDFNLTECTWEIEKLNQSLTNCNESLEEIRELLT